jgi:hypothetical protein
MCWSNPILSFQRCGEKVTIVLKYQLEKLSKVGRKFAKNIYVYH